MRAERVLVTGITGFIGSAVSNHLHSRGFDVYGTVRPGRDLSGSCVSSDRIFRYDLSDNPHACLPSGTVDVIIHCAAATSERAIDAGASRAANIDGTSNLLDWAKKVGISRFIYLSTMSAHGENPSNYAQTKLEAEEVVRASGIGEWVILRPGLVLASASRGIFNKMARQIRVLPFVPTLGRNRCLCTIAMEDLCMAIERAIVVREARAKEIDVCADENLSFGDLARLVAGALGKHPVLIPIPLGVALFVARLSSALGHPVLTEDNVLGIKHARAPDTRLLREVLGIQPRRVEESLRLLSPGAGMGKNRGGISR